MKKETKKKDRIIDTSSDKDVDVFYKQYGDGTFGFEFNFKNLKLKERLEKNAKEVGLTLGGYVLASIFYKNEERLKDIIARHSLKK